MHTSVDKIRIIYVFVHRLKSSELQSHIDSLKKQVIITRVVNSYDSAVMCCACAPSLVTVDIEQWGKAY